MKGFLGKGRNRAGLNIASLSFHDRNESKIRRRASAAPQETRSKPSCRTEIVLRVSYECFLKGARQS